MRECDDCRMHFQSLVSWNLLPLFTSFRTGTTWIHPSSPLQPSLMTSAIELILLYQWADVVGYLVSISLPITVMPLLSFYDNILFLRSTNPQVCTQTANDMSRCRWTSSALNSTSYPMALHSSKLSSVSFDWSAVDSLPWLWTSELWWSSYWTRLGAFNSVARQLMRKMKPRFPYTNWWSRLSSSPTGSFRHCHG